MSPALKPKFISDCLVSLESAVVLWLEEVGISESASGFLLIQICKSSYDVIKFSTSATMLFFLSRDSRCWQREWRSFFIILSFSWFLLQLFSKCQWQPLPLKKHFHGLFFQNASGDISFHIINSISRPWLRITHWFLILDSAIVQYEYSMENIWGIYREICAASSGQSKDLRTAAPNNQADSPLVPLAEE